jgi:hypothetical protein
MASKVPGVSCRLCGEVGHRPSNCWKELGVPPDGFFSGGGSHRDHGDGEDERLNLTVKAVAHQSAHRMMKFNPDCESRGWSLCILPAHLPVRR